MLETPILSTDIDYNNVYDPAEDTFLLMDALESEHNKGQYDLERSTLSLEIGSGSGMISSFIIKHKIFGENNYHLSSDINPLAIKETLKTIKLNGVGRNDVLLMSLLDSVRDGSIDYLVFNPPYVPSDDVPILSDEDRLSVALEGGKNGMEITNLLIEQLSMKLSTEGCAYILFCASNKPLEYKESISDMYNMELIEKRKCGWEVLSIYKITRK
ncbi:related to eRF1 methyltransferase catalytic subunit MTQ2 [Hanseniaspora guilliermondii]|uniref:Related to eRF1 methyltransferase catalytic subunit MTQ2 n=1 Tax=Hanseniaspora guilliermondii TaxID=56406 RepID=A0A1L0FPJ4_9ASCO|nr:related to eRF1 methyltransferase catalytic subunit MTQ2 [Hanseniaspora guilliermondii]